MEKPNCATAWMGFDESLKYHLAAVNKDLAIASEPLAHYESQAGKQNPRIRWLVWS